MSGAGRVGEGVSSEGREWNDETRARIEAALRASEARYRTLFHSIDAGFCVLELLFDDAGVAVDYRFLEVNPTFEAQTGLVDPVGKTARELVPSLDPSWFHIYGEVALTGQPARFENHAPAMGRWFDVYAFRLGEPEERHVALLFNNITERKRRELDGAFLAEVQAEFNRLSHPDEIMRVAAEEIRRYLRVTSVSFAEVDAATETATVIFDGREGRAPSSLGTHRLADYMDDVYLGAMRAGRPVAIGDVRKHPLTAARAKSYLAYHVLAQIHAPYLSGGRWRFLLTAQQQEPREWLPEEVELLAELSERLWLRLERARADEARRESEERFRLALETADMATWAWDPATDEVTYDARLADMLDIATGRPFTIDRLLAEVVHPEDAGAVRVAIQSTLDPAGDGRYRVEFRARRRDGVRWILGHGRIFFGDGTRRPQRLIGTAVDITERKHAEEALRDNDRRKDEFLATLAHELRNPLAPLRNGLEILRLAPSSQATTERIRGMMARQVALMTRMVDDLLEVSRITRGKIELRKARAELASIIRSAVETSMPLIEAGRHELVVSLPKEPLVLEADAVRLAQVFGNLLNNAAKYSPHSGRIVIGAEREGDHVVVSVRDQGVGIPAHVLPRVFDMFAQGDASDGLGQGGLGIGLTLVQSLVRMHAGSVEARSAGVGEGAEFLVRLPIADASVAVAPAGPDALPDAARLRVLVVDDNADAADSLGALLELVGADVRIAYDGPSALDIFGRHAPSVVLLDLGMPGMDGFEVARRLRAEHETDDVTLVALTGWGTSEDRRRTRAAGFHHHLAKPADLMTLRRLLEGDGVG